MLAARSPQLEVASARYPCVRSNAWQGAVISVLGPKELQPIDHAPFEDVFSGLVIRQGIEMAARKSSAWVVTGGTAEGVSSYATAIRIGA